MVKGVQLAVVHMGTVLFLLFLFNRSIQYYRSSNTSNCPIHCSNKSSSLIQYNTQVGKGCLHNKHTYVCNIESSRGDSAAAACFYSKEVMSWLTEKLTLVTSQCASQMFN